MVLPPIDSLGVGEIKAGAYKPGAVAQAMHIGLAGRIFDQVTIFSTELIDRAGRVIPDHPGSNPQDDAVPELAGFSDHPLRIGEVGIELKIIQLGFPGSIDQFDRRG